MSGREVVIYTTMSCPYCHSAKALLEQKGIAFHEIPVDGDRARRADMTARAGGRSSVPQIFIGDRHIGGRDELYALESEAKLDVILHEPAV